MTGVLIRKETQTHRWAEGHVTTVEPLEQSIDKPRNANDCWKVPEAERGREDPPLEPVGSTALRHRDLGPLASSINVCCFGSSSLWDFAIAKTRFLAKIQIQSFLKF